MNRARPRSKTKEGKTREPECDCWLSKTIEISTARFLPRWRPRARAFDGEEGWFRGDTEPYDAVVLDIGLPRRDGISKVQGIDAGSDDYVAKPLHVEGVLRGFAPCCAAPPVTRPAISWAGEAHQPRVPAAVLSDAPRRTHHLAQRNRRASLRAGFRPRLEHDRCVHQPPAQEAWRRHHQNRARTRLSRRRQRGAAGFTVGRPLRFNLSRRLAGMD